MKLTPKQLKQKAQDLLMEQIAKVGIGGDYDEFVKFCGDEDLAIVLLKKQMDRIAKMFGYKGAWFG